MTAGDRDEFSYGLEQGEWTPEGGCPEAGAAGPVSQTPAAPFPIESFAPGMELPLEFRGFPGAPGGGGSAPSITASERTLMITDPLNSGPTLTLPKRNLETAAPTR